VDLKTLGNMVGKPSCTERKIHWGILLAISCCSDNSQNKLLIVSVVVGEIIICISAVKKYFNQKPNCLSDHSMKVF